jgi:hypothetical protein
MAGSYKMKFSKLENSLGNSEIFTPKSPKGDFSFSTFQGVGGEKIS